jgi:hypothetical protein
MDLKAYANRARLLLWISRAGGQITRTALRRNRPGKIQWQPFELLLDELIDDGKVAFCRDELEPIRRGCGKPTTRYALTKSGRESLEVIFAAPEDDE